MTKSKIIEADDIVIGFLVGSLRTEIIYVFCRRGKPPIALLECKATRVSLGEQFEPLAKT